MRILIVFLFVFNVVFAQEKYPKDYFRSPLDIPLAIAGSFGELRPNHFHSGIDFRTQKKEGFPVYATADGFVSRIKISTGGYGKSIYIDHPNGFTTVYGHLQRAVPAIQNILNAEHYSKKSYEIEIFPKPNEILVKKGDLIAYSGNTGNSGGPHLHFEIRDTKSEKIINPLFFGYDSSYIDTKAPQISEILVYPLSYGAQVNGSPNPVAISLSLQKDGTYLSSKISARGKIGFGINAYDISENNYGKNGVFKLNACLNGMPYYNYEFDSFSFDETKYINDFIDYPRYKFQNQRFQKLFVGNMYANNIIKNTKNNGVIDISSNFTMNYKIVLQDFHGNETIVNIPISYDNLPSRDASEALKTAYFLKARNENNYVKEGISVFIPANTFYEDFYLKFDVKNNELLLHDDSVAVSEYMTITFDVSKMVASDKEKMFIANLDGLKNEYNTTLKNDSLFTIKTKKLGKFFLSKDTIAPLVLKPNFIDGANLDKQQTLKVSITDDLSGIASYNAYLNGKWILMEYESKLKRLTHYLSDSVYINGNNKFLIIVKDNLGNSTTFESNFNKTK
ncbi:M23 family metallopeptidase [Flavobacterium sp.]|uniref:M23 family metallopeptidase n=1 Tax=Flavobacterium sp. TaxID=239 RepID=UPI003751C606